MRLLRKPSKRWALGGLMLASVVLMLLPVNCSRWMSRAVQPVLAPLGVPGMHLVDHVRTRAGEMTGGGNPDRDEAVEALMTVIRQRMESQQRTIDELRKWRETLGAFPCKLIDASVVGVESVPLRNRRLLDAGSSEGVRDGDLATTRRLLHRMGVALPRHLTVLGRNYVAGRIVHPGAYTATLQLVIDPEFEMRAQLFRMLRPGAERAIYVRTPEGGKAAKTFRHDNRTPGPYPVGNAVPVLAQGDGRQIVLRQVPAEHGILPGDMVTTRELAELQLPFGLPIGRVTGTRPDEDDAHSVTVFAEPLAKLGTLRQVYIVLPVGR
jgi:cell shape-determining protein MreC